MEKELSIVDLVSRVRRLDSIVKYGFLGSGTGNQSLKRKYLLDHLGRRVILGDNLENQSGSSSDQSP